MPSKFKTRLLKDETIASRGVRIKTIELINAKRNGTFSHEELSLLCQSLMETMPEDTKFRIRGLNPLSWITLKAFDKDLKDDDYYNGRVREEAKFHQFSRLEISFAMPI